MTDPTDQLPVIPIFPLTVVQFPGVVTPLHIFEERYRQLLRDITPGDKQFGIIYPGDLTLPGSELPPAGRVGCTVEVIAQQEMPDGRSNILCAGATRFRTRRYVEGEPYYQAAVEYFDDEVTLEDLSGEVARARKLFERMIAAGRKLRDAEDDAELPDLPEDAAALSYIIAASLDVSLDEKQRWLGMTDSAARLRELAKRAEKLVVEYEQRARIQKIAKVNGHGGKLPE
jgi:Lon protease-like protein